MARDLCVVEDMLVEDTRERCCRRRHWDWRMGGWVEDSMCLEEHLVVLGTFCMCYGGLMKRRELGQGLTGSLFSYIE